MVLWSTIVVVDHARTGVRVDACRLALQETQADQGPCEVQLVQQLTVHHQSSLSIWEPHLSYLRPTMLLQGMRAVQEGRVYVADGNAYINRSGPRVVESCELLAECVWPQLLGRWGHHGASFVSLVQACTIAPKS